MDKSTLLALKGSIRKWERIVAGTGYDKGADNCPLCRLFMNRTGSCDGCPVAEAVEIDGCDETPYMIWDKLTPWNAEGDCVQRKASNQQELAAAQAELDFLRSLLPAHKKDESVHTD